MPKYVIERGLPAAGKLTQTELEAIARQSVDVLGELGPSIQWLYTYVTDDALFCTYIAPNEEAVREHARRGGFPADRVIEIHQLIDPTTAEEVAA